MRVSQLSAWDSGAAGRQAALLRRVMDDVTNGLNVLAGQAAPIMYEDAHWVGTTATAAERVMALRLASGSTVGRTLEEMANALTAFAADIDAAQALLRASLAGAPPELGVNDDGSVYTIPQPPPPDPGPQPHPTPSPSPYAENAIAMKYGSIVNGINESFTLASTADARCAAALTDAESVLDAILGRSAPATLAALDRQAMSPMEWFVYLSTVPPAGTDPARVAEWWACHDPASQRQLIDLIPDQLGNLDGLPPAVRDAANRLRLDAELAGIPPRMAALSAWLQAHPDDYVAQSRLDDLHERLDYMSAVHSQVLRAGEWMSVHRLHDPATGALLPPDVVHLLILDADAFTGRGRAALSYGSTETADNVAVVVPGLRQWVASGFGAVVGNSERTFDAARTLDPAHPVAVVAWIGYDAPGYTEVGMDGRAGHGADRLSATIDGLRAVRVGAPSHLTVVAHSYGSTTAGYAIERHHIPIDDIVFVGSPGVGVNHAANLGMPTDHVWVGAASGDPVTYTQNFGEDPANEKFVGQRFVAEYLGRDHAGVIEEHSQYFNNNSESMANIARIIDAQYGSVVIAAPRTDVLSFGLPHLGPLSPGQPESEPESSRPVTSPSTTSTP